jgi:3-keto-L-gulonate-6-phosphate decarboxylase
MSNKRWVQTVIDTLDLDSAIQVAEVAVTYGSEWIGVGTSLMYSAGFIRAIPAVKKTVGNIPVVANLKTHDGGYLFAEQAKMYGADYGTITAISNYGCCREAVRAQNALGIKMIADLANVNQKDMAHYAAELESIGVTAICVHFSHDDAKYHGMFGRCCDGVREAKGVVKKISIGCIVRTLDDINGALEQGADWIALTGDYVDKGGTEGFKSLKESIQLVHSY